MSTQKKKSNNQLEKVLLVTALLGLLEKIISLIIQLLKWGS